ncbi:MAG: hypothetical protein ACLR2E_04380 [Lachnospiraceae bacterium]
MGRREWIKIQKTYYRDPEAWSLYSLRRFRQGPEAGNYKVTLHKGDYCLRLWKDRLRKDAASGGYRVPGLRRFPSGRKMRINGLELTEELRLELENRFVPACPRYELCHGTFLPGFYFSACRKQEDSLYGRTHGENPPPAPTPWPGAPSPEDMITALSGGQSRT